MLAARRLVFLFQEQLENVNFNMQSNGEERVIRVFASHVPQPTVLDVGANVGDWSKLVLQYLPECRLATFEIVPETADLLEQNLGSYQQVTFNRLGLSDREDTVTIWRKRATGGDSTAFPIEGFERHKEKYQYSIDCRVTTGAAYLEQAASQRIDLLKIDTEGMELSVLKGFGEHLATVRLIQFEYGVFNISSRALLVDFFNLLTPLGFAIGKIFPHGVEFFDYHFSREDFRGNNYVAVKSSDVELQRALAGNYDGAHQR